MEPVPTSPSERAFEDATRALNAQDLVLRLYVAGMTARSAGAIRSIKAICEEHFAGHYDLQVFDLYQTPEEARAVDVIAAPTLVKIGPGQPVRLIGSLEDRARVMHSLGVPEAAP